MNMKYNFPIALLFWHKSCFWRTADECGLFFDVRINN